jgi:DNA-binding NarL/FixJ family response regulator
VSGITFMPGAALSPREAQILTLMAEEGFTAKEVAHKFNVSHRTVEIQVANAITKLGARNRMQAVVWWDRKHRQE